MARCALLLDLPRTIRGVSGWFSRLPALDSDNSRTERRRHLAPPMPRAKAAAAEIPSVPPVPPANPWEQVRRLMEPNLSPASVETWLAPTSFLKQEDSTLFVQVPTSTFRTWIHQHAQEQLVAALSHLPAIDRIEWVVPEHPPKNGTKHEQPPGILLSEVKREQVEWLWQHRIPLGKITILDGDPGMGKSLLTLNIAARLTTGKPLPGQTVVQKGGVVILSAEDGLGDTIRPRLEAANADLKRIVALKYVPDWAGEQTVSNIPVEIPTVRAAIHRVRAKLVIVDVLMAYLASDTNSWRDQDIRLALAPLSEMASRERVAVLCIRHLTKAPGGNPLYRGGGSIGIIGGARAGLLVAKDPKDPSITVLAQTKSNLGPPMPSLKFRIKADANGVPYIDWKGESQETAGSLLASTVGDDEQRGAVAEAQKFLLRELGNGQVRRTDLQDACKRAGIANRTIQRAKHLLGVKSQKVGSGEKSYWVWKLPKGVQRLPTSTI